jgi:hypothetical protein
VQNPKAGTRLFVTTSDIGVKQPEIVPGCVAVRSAQESAFRAPKDDAARVDADKQQSMRRRISLALDDHRDGVSSAETERRKPKALVVAR